MRSGSSATGNNSFNNLVDTGSNKHIVGLDEVICLFSSSCLKLKVYIQYNYVLTCVCKVLSTFMLFRKKVIPVHNNML